MTDISPEYTFSSYIQENIQQLHLTSITAVLTLDDDSSKVAMTICETSDSFGFLDALDGTFYSIGKEPPVGEKQQEVYLHILEKLNAGVALFTYSEKWTAIARAALYWDVTGEVDGRTSALMKQVSECTDVMKQVRESHASPSSVASSPTLEQYSTAYAFGSGSGGYGAVLDRLLRDSPRHRDISPIQDIDFRDKGHNGSYSFNDLGIF